MKRKFIFNAFSEGETLDLNVTASQQALLKAGKNDKLNLSIVVQQNWEKHLGPAVLALEKKDGYLGDRQCGLFDVLTGRGLFFSTANGAPLLEASQTSASEGLPTTFMVNVKKR
jgi:hypothetical protein